MSWDDEFDEEDDVPDDPEESFTLPCPCCGASVYEDSEQCSHCGEYITRSTHPFSGKPLWYVALALLGICAVIIALL